MSNKKDGFIDKIPIHNHFIDIDFDRNNKKLCPICNGDMGVFTDLCDGCWNVERYIDEYISTKKGRNRLLKKITDKIKEEAILKKSRITRKYQKILKRVDKYVK